MSKTNNLKECLTELARTDAALTELILSLDKGRLKNQFEFVNTLKGELNLKYKKKFNSWLFHSEHGAVKECSQWLDSFQPRCQVLYVFGVGLGYSFFKIQQYLKTNIELQIVFIEPYLEVLFYLFQTELGKKIVTHPRVHLAHFHNKMTLALMIDRLNCEFSMLKAHVLVSPVYEKRFPKIAHFLSSNIPQVHKELSSLIMEGFSSYDNTFRNFTRLALNLGGRYNASGFLNAFENVPCIIVGAGPSLQKNIDLLKSLSQKALIIAGSSAIPGITQQGFQPHMGHFFDPYLRVYSRFLANIAFELPTFHCARTFSEVSRWMHGPKMYIKGSQTFPVVNWVEEALGFRGAQDPELISVSASNTFMAQLMGCSPIIYVGLDLAYTQNLSYMDGVPTAEHKQEELIENESNTFAFNEKLTHQDIYGQPIQTKYGWILESKLLNEMIQTTPHLKFINATEGGLGIQGVPNLSLQQVLNDYLQKNYPMEEKVHAILQNSPQASKASQKKATTHLKEFSKSLSRCLKSYSDTLKAFQKMSKKNKAESLQELDTHFLIEHMQNISHEIAYQYLMKRYHQLIDIPKIKNRFLKRSLSSNSPSILANHLSIQDMLSRFEQYLMISEQLQAILLNSLKEAKEDPW